MDDGIIVEVGMIHKLKELGVTNGWEKKCSIESITGAAQRSEDSCDITGNNIAGLHYGTDRERHGKK